MAIILPAARVMAVELSAPHPGYTFDIQQEREQVSHEVVIMPPLDLFDKPQTDVIFTEKMSKEFSHEFRYRFGFTEFEQIEFTSNRFVSSGDNSRLVPVDEFIDKQESFGQYMIRELAEYHVDNYLKSGKRTRVIYKAKEAISNVEVAAPSGYKVKMRYKISSNRMVFKLERRGEKFHKEIVTKVNGDGATLRLAYDVSKTLRLGADYAPIDEVIAVRGEKRLTPSLATSITGQSFQKDLASAPRQERILLGFSWSD